jgi:hypothetical protein
MTIDGEPRDGDYVRYIEQLTNRGQISPGQVVARSRETAAIPPAAPAPGEVVPVGSKAAGASGLPQNPAGTSTEARPAPNDGGAEAAGATLASQAARRRAAWAVTLVALALAWQALRMLSESLRAPDFDPHDLVPAAFLLIFAGMLWRAARSQGAKAQRPPARLPPLSTISAKNTTRR